MAFSPDMLPSTDISVPSSGVWLSPSLDAEVQSEQHWISTKPARKMRTLYPARTDSVLKASDPCRCLVQDFQSTIPISKARQNY